MVNKSVAISVQIDKEDKEKATLILKDLGLNMSSYINIAIKQLILRDGVPFEIVLPRDFDNSANN